MSIVSYLGPKNLNVWWFSVIHNLPCSKTIITVAWIANNRFPEEYIKVWGKGCWAFGTECDVNCSSEYFHNVWLLVGVTTIRNLE